MKYHSLATGLIGSFATDGMYLGAPDKILVSSDGMKWVEQPAQHGYTGHQFTERVKLKGPPKSIHERPIGRNTSCPCGSGNKFSQCCLRFRG